MTKIHAKKKPKARIAPLKHETNEANPVTCPIDSPNPGTEPSPEPVKLPDPKGARVLLLEDDPAFSEAIRDLLTECGYNVTAVQSGVDGIQEVMAGEFALILCDMMMPGLPGDLFYRAVERAHPEMCDRFVFMTGHRGDGRANDFIKSVKGHALLKPFRLDALLDAIRFMEARRQFALEAAASAAVPANLRAPAPLASIVPNDNQLALSTPSRGPVSLPMAGSEEPVSWFQPREDMRRPIAGVLLLLILFVALAAVPASEYLNTRERVAAASATRDVLAGEWAFISDRLREAEGARQKLETARSAPERFAKVRAWKRWTPALRAVATAAESGIQIEGVEAREIKESDGWEMRLTGVATSAQPRATAEKFRLTLERQLMLPFIGLNVTTHFEQLDVEPGDAEDDAPSAVPGEESADFVMVAVIGETSGVADPKKEAR